jgi:hypothetical protein
MVRQEIIVDKNMTFFTAQANNPGALVNKGANSLELKAIRKILPN